MQLKEIDVTTFSDMQVAVVAQCLHNYFNSIQNERFEMQKRIEIFMKKYNELNELKEKHELPNENHTEYNNGYVKAINDSLNKLKL